MNCKMIFTIYFMIIALSVSAYGVTINETLDTTAPAANPAYRAKTGTQTGRLTRDGTPSACGSIKPNPGLGFPTGSRQYDDYRFVALSGGCVTVTISNAGNDVLFVVAYDQTGLNIADPSLNYLADAGSSPTTTVPTRVFSFNVAPGQIFHIVVSEVSPAGAVGQTYTLNFSGVKIDPDFTVTEVLDTTTPQLDSAYSGSTVGQTGRLNRFAPASDCSGLKPNPGLFSATGARRTDLYSFTPTSSGCARVTLSHTGADQANVVAYDQNGFVAANPSTNYLADSGASAVNNSVTFSFLVTRGVPFSIVVHEVNPGAGTGDSYTLNMSNVKLVPTVRVTSTLDVIPPAANPDYVAGTGAQTGRLNRFAPPTDCNAPKAPPGLFSPVGARQYDLYTFVPARSGCVEVTMYAYQVGFDLFAVAYNNLGFVAANPGSNYLADIGTSPNNANPRTFSFNVTAGVPFSIVVHEVNPAAGIGQAYTLEVGGIALNVTTPGMFDFDGDGKDDHSVYRNGIWYLLRSTAGFAAVNWGLPTDKTVAGDYDGDGKTDTAIFRNGLWAIQNSSNNAVSIMNWGLAGDIPMVGDYDGDNKTDLAVFRNGVWYILQSSNGGFLFASFGLATDKPVVGKFDADNKSDIAVFRNGNWYILGSTAGFSAVGWGTTGDIPVPGDYDGDAQTDVAVFRGGNWYILGSAAGFSAVGWGLGTDTPVPADYDGDGKSDVAVFRNGDWYILQSSNGAFSAVGFGTTGDRPIPAQLQ